MAIVTKIAVLGFSSRQNGDSIICIISHLLALFLICEHLHAASIKASTLSTITRKTISMFRKFRIFVRIACRRGTGEEEQLINHKMAPLQLSSDGKIWLTLCTASLSSHSDIGNKEVKRTGFPTRWKTIEK